MYISKVAHMNETCHKYKFCHVTHSGLPFTFVPPHRNTHLKDLYAKCTLCLDAYDVYVHICIYIHVYIHIYIYILIYMFISRVRVTEHVPSHARLLIPKSCWLFTYCNKLFT